MNDEESFHFEDDRFIGVHPNQIVQNLLEVTRDLGMKTNTEIDKIPNSLSQNKGNFCQELIIYP